MQWLLVTSNQLTNYFCTLITGQFFSALRGIHKENTNCYDSVAPSEAVAAVSCHRHCCCSRLIYTVLILSVVLPSVHYMGTPPKIPGRYIVIKHPLTFYRSWLFLADQGRCLSSDGWAMALSVMVRWFNEDALGFGLVEALPCGYLVRVLSLLAFKCIIYRVTLSYRDI